jgi:hypothetical protein
MTSWYIYGDGDIIHHEHQSKHALEFYLIELEIVEIGNARSSLALLTRRAAKIVTRFARLN